MHTGALRAVFLPPQQLGQLGDVGGDAPDLVAEEQVRRRAPPRLVLEIVVGERLAVLDRVCH
jgi:hypothetical protein